MSEACASAWLRREIMPRTGVTSALQVRPPGVDGTCWTRLDAQVSCSGGRVLGGIKLSVKGKRHKKGGYGRKYILHRGPEVCGEDDSIV